MTRSMSFFLKTLNPAISSNSVPDWFTDRTVLNLKGNQIIGEPGGLLFQVICFVLLFHGRDLAVAQEICR